MIAEQSTVLQTQSPSVITQAWSAPVSRHALAAIGTMAFALTRTLISWVRTGAVPYATLWEASLTVDLLTERDTHKPDAFSADVTFTTDSWLRG
jgi:hypothetical protein